MNCRKTRDLKFLSARRGLDFYFIAHFFAKQRAANGRRSGNHAFGDVRFFRSDELVFGFLGLAEFKEAHGGAVGGAIVRKIVEVEHGNFRHAAMQLAESRGDEGLALLGVFVLGIFGEVAVGAGLHELFGELIVKFMFELRDFSWGNFSYLCRKKQQLTLKLMDFARLICPPLELFFPWVQKPPSHPGSLL